MFINYGPHGNRKLLLEYGFVLPYNCHNSVKIDSKLVYDVISKHGCISKTKYDIIAKYELEEAYYCSSNGLSWSLETAFKILASNDIKLKQKSLQIDKLQMSTENKKLAGIFAKEILKLILVGYQEDLTRVWSCNEGPDLSEKMGQLITLLQQEINIVRTALSSLL